jgi:hypothetical protein
MVSSKQISTEIEFQMAGIGVNATRCPGHSPALLKQTALKGWIVNDKRLKSEEVFHRVPSVTLSKLI